jgi:hypothetical protein
MRLTQFRPSIFVAAGFAILAVARVTPAEPARQLGDLSGPWQLFVDDYLVAEKTHVVRTYHPFQKRAGNPVLVADKPWEGTMAYLYGTVLPREDGPGYRMWYHSWAEGEYRKLYAVSADGLKWEKPDLGIVTYKGSTKNNLLFRRTHEDHTPQVIHTPWEADPQRRYKLINYDYGRTPPKNTVSGYYGALSPDGIHWTDVPQNPVLRDPGDVGCFVWDQHTKRYLGYPKKFTDVRGFRRRCVGFSETTTFESWPESRMVLIPDEYDDRWVSKPGQHTDFYGLSGFAYESMYIGFLWIFRITDGNNDGPIFVELVSSHDGVDWIREEEPRTPILPLGPTGSWDGGMVFTPNHPLVESDTIKLYYGGINVTHGAGKEAGAIGLATLRKDGFASLDAGGAAGTITTKRLLGAAGPLRVNYKAAGGSLKVEVLDENGKALPGFSRDDCEPLNGDSVDQVVRWKGSSEVPRQTGPVRFRFVLQNAAIYSFAAGDSMHLLQPDSGVVYTFEGDTGTKVADKLASDDARAARFHNGVAVDTDKANAAFGTSSLAFRGDGAKLDTLEIPGTASLGTEFTLAAVIKPTGKGFTRLFSTYRGSGPPVTSELIFDFDPSGSQVSGLRGVVNGGEVQSTTVGLADGKYHHCALTYANGKVKLFFDGQDVGDDEVPAGPVLLAADLRVGEDLGGAVNEQFVGHVDDVVVLARALTAQEIKVLSQQGADAFLARRTETARPLRPSRPTPATAPAEPRVRDIGSRLELFVDHYLIDKLDGARLTLQHPQPAEVALVFDRPWEGVAVGYVTVIKDTDRYRMYYRGMPDSNAPDGTDIETTCYAESNDGVTWTKPNLGLYEVQGTRENNVILAHSPPSSHNFSPFVDARPGVPPAEQYKALALGKGGLLAFASADGIRWKKLQDAPVITRGAFDSQNVGFWSEMEGCYLCYFRTWRNNTRWISRTASKDFLHWTNPIDMTFGDTPPEHLYTNQTHPYFRAPHIYIATAARFMPGKRVVTDAQLRAAGIDLKSWLKDDCSEVVLLTSRGGSRYDRTFMEAFLRPGPDPRNWVSRTNYPALNVVQTGPTEMSLYVQKDNGQATHHLQRYTLRLDGFASVNAPYGGGEMLTKPFTFTGKQLLLNCATSAAGGVRVEIQDESGKPMAGRTLADCPEIAGDEIERVISWQGGSDVSALAGKPVRLRFVMKDADLYSIRFR